MPAGTRRRELTSPGRTGGCDAGMLLAPTPAGTRRLRFAITSQAKRHRTGAPPPDAASDRLARR